MTDAELAAVPAVQKWRTQIMGPPGVQAPGITGHGSWPLLCKHATPFQQETLAENAWCVVPVNGTLMVLYKIAVYRIFDPSASSAGWYRGAGCMHPKAADACTFVDGMLLLKLWLESEPDILLAIGGDPYRHAP